MPNKIHDLDLMQHADGELESDLALDSLDAEARAKIEALAHTREAVRGSVELAADAVPEAKFARMWGEIDKVLANTAAPAERSREIVPAPEHRSMIRRIGGWLDRHMGHIVTGVVSAGAVAAIALIVRGGGEGSLAGSGGGAIDVQPASLRAPVEIESLDTPDGQGTVINLEDEDGHATVIWVSPADTVEGI